MVDSGNMRGARQTERRSRKVIVPELTGMRLRDAQIVSVQAGFATADGQPNVQVRYVEAYADDFQVVAQVPLRGDGRDEFLVAGGERLSPAPSRQIDDAQRHPALWRGPHDWHTQHRAAPDRRFDVRLHGAVGHQQGVLRAKDASRHGRRVVHRNVGYRPGRPEHRRGTQQPHGAIEHIDGAASRAHRLGNLGEDGGRRILERHGAPQDLANGIEEVDLLVPFGQVLRGVTHLELRTQHLRGNRQEQLGAQSRRARVGTGAEHQPHRPRAGHARHDLQPARGVALPHALGGAQFRRRRVRIARVAPFDLQGILRRTLCPHRHRASGGLVKGRQDGVEVTHETARALGR